MPKLNMPKVDTGFPDVCMTPAGPLAVPIPYPNLGTAGKQGLERLGLSGGAVKDVMAGKIPGKAPDKLLLANKIKPSKGDAAGVAKGLTSAKQMGPAKFLMGAGKVLIQGKP